MRDIRDVSLSQSTTQADLFTRGKALLMLKLLPIKITEMQCYQKPKMQFLPTFLCEETSECRTSNATVLWRYPNSRACAELHLRFCFRQRGDLSEVWLTNESNSVKSKQNNILNSPPPHSKTLNLVHSLLTPECLNFCQHCYFFMAAQRNAKTHMKRAE